MRLRALIGGEKELRRHIKRMQVMGSIVLVLSIQGTIMKVSLGLGLGFGLGFLSVIFCVVK